MTLDGTLQLDGRPVGGQDVLAFDTSGERPALLATAVTDDEGRFALDAGEGATLLGKLRGDVLAPVTGDGDVLEARGPFARLRARIESDAGYPERLVVSLDPVEVAGLEPALTPFATQKAPGVFEGSYAQRTVTGREFALSLAPGTWRLRGEFIVHERPMIVDPDFSNYAVERVLDAGGDELEPDRGGFLVHADGDVDLTLVLRVLSDEEL